MNLNEFVKETFTDTEFVMRPQIVCKDGFKMSVQGSIGHYCSPRMNLDSYFRMEIGYPSEPEESILEFAEDKDSPTDTVYGFVPCEIIQALIDKHGGIDVKKTFEKRTKNQ